MIYIEAQHFFACRACFIYGWQASQPGFCVHLCRLLLCSILENMIIGFQPFCVRILDYSTIGYLMTCATFGSCQAPDSGTQKLILDNLIIEFQPFCVRILDYSTIGYLMTCDIWFMPSARFWNSKTDTRQFDNRVSTLLCSHTRLFDNRVSNDMRHLVHAKSRFWNSEN
jgi:hypothetical protein